MCTALDRSLALPIGSICVAAYGQEKDTGFLPFSFSELWLFVALGQQKGRQGLNLILWLQPAVFFSHTKSATAISTSQPAVLFSHNKSAPATSRSQPNRVHV